MTRLHIDIEGMTCGHCTSRVEKALEKLEALSDIEVDLEHHNASATLAMDLDERLREEVTDAIEFAGFDVLDVREEPEEGAGDRHDEQNSRDEVSPAPSSGDEPARASTDARATAAPKVQKDDLAQTSGQTEGKHAIEIDVRGMTCASCVARVEKALAGSERVSSASVNYATEVATVYIEQPPEQEQLDALRGLVEQAGYDVEAIRVRDGDASSAHGSSSTATSSESQRPQKEAASARRAREALAWKSRWMWGVALTIPIMFAQMGPMWFDFELSGAAEIGRLGIVAYLTALVLGASGRPFFKGAISGIKHGSVNMDTLVAMGAGAAFLSSLISLILLATGSSRSLGIHFDGAAMIVTLIGVGKWLEARAKGDASKALESLLAQSASSARVWRDAQWKEIPVDQVAQGDKVSVRAGEKIPVDADVTEGRASVDESMMTGEPVPVTREEGDEVFAGTINVDGNLVLRATRIASESTLAQIASEVERAQAAKADIQRVADRISGVFVPVVLLVAVITFIGWWIFSGDVAAAIVPAVAVLVVACPCALGLATPTALLVGSSRAASKGILLRDPDALERAKKLDALIFDKTGTLTQGKMSLRSIETSGESEDFILALAAAMEEGSTHPIANALTQAALERSLDEAGPIEDFESFAGHGIAATIDGTRYWLGEATWVIEKVGEDAIEEERLAALNAAEASAHTSIALGVQNQLLGWFVLEDALKESASEVIAKLQDRGVEIWMITGDAQGSAEHVARELGISPEHVRARVKPQEKSSAVRELQEKGHAVGMVGDGINDAAALAAADLGIAIGAGADVALEAADIVLVSEELATVVRAIDIARTTHGRIRQNLFWAFFYNLALIPIAALGWLIPAMAAGAMALSSVSVVTNSLRPHRLR
jgi:Cu+-exporting ATPase